MNAHNPTYKPAEGHGILAACLWLTGSNTIQMLLASCLPSLLILSLLGFLEVELWSGLKKGPPRKLKFPEPNKVVEMLKGNLE